MMYSFSDLASEDDEPVSRAELVTEALDKLIGTCLSEVETVFTLTEKGKAGREDWTNMYGFVEEAAVDVAGKHAHDHESTLVDVEPESMRICKMETLLLLRA